MKKPEKKNIEEIVEEHKKQGATKLDIIYALSEPNGYNKACDDWEKFLPDEKEIKKIIYDNYDCRKNVFGKDLSKAILKRIGKK